MKWLQLQTDSAIMARSEASGLLMSVIRTLHETDTGQEREEEKRKLEAEFKQCDHALDKMVASHQGELSSVMATYSTVSWSFCWSGLFHCPCRCLVDCTRLVQG